MNLQPLTPQSAGITGPMNINAVITHLIEMTPGQRKQFAQIHMDDPMMLSAAKFVDNQVNKQAQSLAAQAIGAAPPPVNQQVVAGMAPEPQAKLPEDTGIAQIPAPNMQKVVHAAGGGIVAFSGENGSQVRGLPVSAETAAMYQNAGKTGESIGTGIKEMLQSVNAGLTDAGTNYLKAKISRNEPLTGVERAQAIRAGINIPVTSTPITSSAKDYSPESQYTGSNYGNKPPVSQEARRDDRPNLSSLKGQTDKPLSRSDNTGGGPRVDTSPTAPVASTYKETPYVPEKSEGLEKLLKGYQDAQGAAVDPYAAQHEESRKSREQMALDEMAGAKERQAGINTLLSGKEARIKQREERLNQQDDVNLNMSLINAGLSMMQSTGKGLAGIAEGAQKGVGQYTEGLKMSEAARQKIEEARDAHDDLRFNLNNMSSKEIQAAKRSMEEGKIVSTNEAITAIMHQEGLNRADATALFAARVNQIASDKQLAYNAAEAARNREYQSGENRAQQTFTAAESAKARAAAAAQAGASLALHERLANKPGETQKMLTALGGGDINKGYDIYTKGRQEGGMDKVRLTQAEKWLDNNMNNPAFNKNADPKLWEQAKAVVSSSFMPILDSSKVNGPILQKPQR